MSSSFRFTPFVAATLALSVISAPRAEGEKAWTPIGSKNKPKSAETKGKPEPVRADSKERKGYLATIEKTANMVSDARAQQMAQSVGLGIMNVTWEDTGRFKGSAVGPNISDLTIQVGVKNPGTNGYDLKLMPVIRYANFSDRTSDVDPREFTLLVGNEKDKPLKRISLREFLEDPTKHLSKPESWLNKQKSLLAEKRDSKVLVSAQACFLPVPKKGKAEFNPVIFNYQSHSGDPAVLTLLVSRQGTSVTIIDNKRDTLGETGGWGQRLFHNQNGQRASLTGERMSDFAQSAEAKKIGEIKDLKLDPKKSSGLNMVLIIQVPLKQKSPPLGSKSTMYMAQTMEGAPSSPPQKQESDDQSNVEAAVIGHGTFEGPFTEIDNLSIERDDRFPVRVTVQFYKATNNGVMSNQDIQQIKAEIDGVLNNGDNVGSLVVSGETGRPTEYEGIKAQPADWWSDFFKRHEQNTGEKRADVIARLRKLLGEKYERIEVSELFLAERLHRDSEKKSP